MRNASFLVYLPDPFGLGRAEFFMQNQQGQAAAITGAALENAETLIVTIEAARLIAELRSLGLDPPQNLVDLTEALRLWRGKAKRDGGARASDPWRFLKGVVGGHDAAAVIGQFHKLFEAQGEWPEAETTRLELFKAVGRALQAAWAEVCAGLDESGEFERFDTIERPVAQVFYGRQSAGIGIDLEKVRDFISKADREKYTAYNQIAETLQVSPSGLHFRNVGPLLDRTDAPHLSQYSDAPNFEEYVRLAATYSTFADQLVTLVTASRDLRALARLRGEATGIARPEFQIMGTVSGRILVSNPSLQHIRRRYRDVVAAVDGRKLAYLDFAQFEPGILASLSQDRQFIDRYNNGDIYAELAVALFDDVKQRDVAKRMFLSFNYGMSLDRVVALLGGGNAVERLAAFERFVSNFPGILEFRKIREADLQRNGYVDTLMGNKRYRTGEGALKNDERRWAVSQSVQGTASLIFKEVVLGISRHLGPEAILLPMHDAVLVQLPEAKYDADIQTVQEIMLATLSTRCPEIVGRVVVADHF